MRCLTLTLLTLLTLLALAPNTPAAIVLTDTNIGTVFIGAHTGNGAGMTNLSGAMVAYVTNVTLSAATTLVVKHTPFTDNTTNYSVSAPNDLVGATVTVRTPTNFTLSFTAATLTSQTIEGVCVHR